MTKFPNPMVRVWNYNKSRIHSYRGARYVEMHLDEAPIFKGEIKRAGVLLNEQIFGEGDYESNDDDGAADASGWRQRAQDARAGQRARVRKRRRGANVDLWAMYIGEPGMG